MRLIKSVSVTFAARITYIFLSIISSIIVARALGPVGKGVFAVLAAIVGIALQFGNFGLHASNIYFVSREKNKISQISGNSLWVGIIGGSVIAVLAYLISTAFPNLLLGKIQPVLLLIMLISVPFVFITLFLTNILIGLQKIYQYNLIEVAGKLLSVILTAVILIILGRGIFDLVVLSTVITILLCLVYVIYFQVHYGFCYKFDGQLFNRMLRYGFKAYLSCLFAFLIIRSDIILVNYFLGVSKTGIYSVAVSFADLLFLLPTTIGMMLFPKASEIQDRKSNLTKKVSRFTVLLMLMLCVFAAMVSKPLILLMYGQQFKGSILPFLWLLPGVFFLSLEAIYMNDFASRGNPSIVYIVPATALVLNVSLNIIMIPRIGVVAASITSTISYGFMFLVTLEYLRFVSGSSHKELLVIKPKEIKELFLEAVAKFQSREEDTEKE